MMLSVDDATSIVLRHAVRLPPVQCALAVCLGRVMAEDVRSDLDMPPFDKAMMDGYAVQSADVPGELAVIEEITAGMTPSAAIGPGQASRIMTGAPIPDGTDAVVMIEKCEPLDGDRRVRIAGAAVKGQNIQPQARELRRGETVLQSGTVLRAAEVGLLAIVGRANVQVYPSPEVAVLSTGDELVEPGQTPGPGQIRNSNGPMLVAQVSRAGARPRPLGIARDRLDDLRERIAYGLRSPVLILSGGVSAGRLDLVPGVLAERGVEPRFHKVAMKPGKPLFFGTRGEHLVFGLPGNPVSAFVGFELFVRPAIDVLSGRPAQPPPFVPMPLAIDFPFASDRPTYHPAKLHAGAVEPVEWRGSPDLRAVTLSDALILLQPGERVYRAGELVPVLAWSRH